MPQDAFHIRRSTEELNSLLKGSKINRITQSSKDEVTLNLYTKKTIAKLILSTNASNARICLTNTEKPPLPVAPNFCMLLRKHILGAEIISISQYKFERIIEITLRCTTDFSQCNRILYCEIMGKYSNLILVDNGIILGALKTASLEDNVHRILFPGVAYSYPSPQEKISHTDTSKLKELLKSYSTTNETNDIESLAQFIFSNVSGLALPTIRYILSKNPHTQPLWTYISDFCENENNAPHILYKDGIPQDFFAFSVPDGIPCPSLNYAEDKYYSEKEEKRAFEDEKKKIFSAVNNLQKKDKKKLADILQRLKDAENGENNRLKGELLTANIYLLRQGMDSIILDNWYDNTKIKIALDPNLPPSKNAQKYFKAYSKQKRTIEALLPRKEIVKKELDYTNSIKYSIESSESRSDLEEIYTELVNLGLLKAKKEKVGIKKKTDVPFRAYKYNDFTIYSGRNNIQNDRLIKQSSSNDIWLHAHTIHSSHIIIQTEGKQITNDLLLFAAEICAYYSEAKNESKVFIDYCMKKFVKKPSKSPAGFVTYTDYKTIAVKPNKHNDYTV